MGNLTIKFLLFKDVSSVDLDHQVGLENVGDDVGDCLKTMENLWKCLLNIHEILRNFVNPNFSEYSEGGPSISVLTT